MIDDALLAFKQGGGNTSLIEHELRDYLQRDVVLDIIQNGMRSYMLPEFVNSGGQGFKPGSRYNKHKPIIHHSLAKLSQSGKALAIPIDCVKIFDIKRTHPIRETWTESHKPEGRCCGNCSYSPTGFLSVNAGTDVVSSDKYYTPVKLPTVKDIADLIVNQYFYHNGRHKDISARHPLFTVFKNDSDLMSDERVAFDQNCFSSVDDDSVSCNSCLHFNSMSRTSLLTDEGVGTVEQVNVEFLENLDCGCLDTMPVDVIDVVLNLSMADREMLPHVVYPTSRSSLIGCEPMTTITATTSSCGTITSSCGAINSCSDVVSTVTVLLAVRWLLSSHLHGHLLLMMVCIAHG